MNKAAQQLGKLGGAARKRQKPDYSAMGKKGMARRWGVKISGQPIGLPPVEEMLETLAKRSKVTVIPGAGIIVDKKDDKGTGHFSGKYCPKCGATTLINQNGDEWCSFVECDWGL